MIATACLAVVSKSLQQCLQDAINIAAEYAGREPCEVVIPRDFEVDPLDGSEIAQVVNMFNSGLVDQATALEMLKHGEVLPEEVEVDQVMSNSENEELADLEMQVKRTEAMAEVGEGTPAAEDN